MPRTTPVHYGYSILNGAGTGSNGGRIHVWVEYLVGEADVSGNRTYLTAYFYAALDPNYTSSTSYYRGLNSAFSVDGQSAAGVSDGSYNFTSADSPNLLGSFAGYISHDSDGTKTVSLSGSFTTTSSYITGGHVSGTISLPDIPRAATVQAADVTLGMSCNVSWTPSAASHSFSLAFQLGEWSATSDRLYPGTTRQYTYTGQVLPLEVACRFAGATAQMEVRLTTYDGNHVLGTYADTFTVTLPENDSTRPSVSAQLSPVCQAFPGRYIQKLGKVSAAITAVDPLGAEITGYTITTGNTTVTGNVSDFLENSGPVEVVVTATNSRGFTGSWRGEISVTPYDSPRLLTADAYRCLSDGNADPGGTFLRIVATWVSSPLEGENTCTLRWRIKPEGGTWSDWHLLQNVDSADTGAISGVVLEKTRAYTVELSAVDTAGGSASASYSIPIEQVYMHRTKNAMGLGGYAQGNDVLDIHWDIQARKDFHCQGAVSGVYIRAIYLSGSREICLQTKWDTMNGQGNSRQSVFLFGYDNSFLIRGVLGVSDAGRCTWSGTENVTATADSTTGIVTIQLPTTAFDHFVLISPEEITLVSP